uniref:Acyl-CoA dehydrogenase family member 9 n=1 Tax=Timema shepardi TaxID=629360 RepID=A0A7R9APN4_TIMSH|nr:unnamed protein product [Timema shepardi]
MLTCWTNSNSRFLPALCLPPVDSAAIDSAGCIPPDILEGLKQLDLFGQQIPVEYGGLGLTVTEFARLSEALASDPSIFLLLAAHQLLGLQGLLIAGTEEQKYRYLPRLANGDWVAALCLSESESGSDLTSIKTQATLSEDGDTWVINGSKNWVTNGNIANLYIVFAKTKMEDHKGQIHDRTTAFLVEREFEGVSCGQPDDKLGIRGTSTCEVFFKETPVPVENVLGEVNKGFNLALDILNGSRYGMGGLLTEVLKKFIGWATEHVVNRNQLGKTLKDFELIQEKLAKVTSTTYAVESMTYLLAAMLDTYEDPDCTMEAAMLKVFGTETCWNGINDCLQLLGGKGYLKNYPYERLLRDMRITMLVDGANDALRFFIAFKGLQHVGPLLNERVKGMRNPLNNPGLVFKTLWKRRNQDKDDPSLNLGLCNNLHPALEVPSKLLEYCVLRLQYASEMVLTRHGSEVGEHQMELSRLADIAIDVFAMTAVLGRASRSYCIGLQNGSDEMLIASVFCHDAYERVKAHIKNLENAPFGSNHVNYRTIASKVLKKHLVVNKINLTI